MSFTTKLVKCIKDKQIEAVFTNLDYMKHCEEPFVSKQHNNILLYQFFLMFFYFLRERETA